MHPSPTQPIRPPHFGFGFRFRPEGMRLRRWQKQNLRNGTARKRASAKTMTPSCPSSPPVFSPLEAAQMEHDDWLTGPYTDDWLDVPDIPSTWNLEDDE